MVEVFATNVSERTDADRIIILLNRVFPSSRINFDLDDCDRILRIEGREFTIEKVMVVVRQNGFECRVLE